jgi:DNA invertase Pin-like site-specific DNA recombinase
MMQMLGAFAEFEREMIRERTRSGLRHAREQGRRSGRKPKLSKAQKREVIETVSSGRKSGAEVARLFEIHPSTVSRLLASSGSIVPLTD